MITIVANNEDKLSKDIKASIFIEAKNNTYAHSSDKWMINNFNYNCEDIADDPDFKPAKDAISSLCIKHTEKSATVVCETNAKHINYIDIKDNENAHNNALTYRLICRNIVELNAENITNIVEAVAYFCKKNNGETIDINDIKVVGIKMVYYICSTNLDQKNYDVSIRIKTLVENIITSINTNVSVITNKMNKIENDMKSDKKEILDKISDLQKYKSINRTMVKIDLDSTKVDIINNAKINTDLIVNNVKANTNLIVDNAKANADCMVTNFTKVMKNAEVIISNATANTNLIISNVKVNADLIMNNAKTNTDLVISNIATIIKNDEIINNNINLRADDIINKITNVITNTFANLSVNASTNTQTNSRLLLKSNQDLIQKFDMKDDDDNNESEIKTDVEKSLRNLYKRYSAGHIKPKYAIETIEIILAKKLNLFSKKELDKKYCGFGCNYDRQSYNFPSKGDILHIGIENYVVIRCALMTFDIELYDYNSILNEFENIYKQYPQIILESKEFIKMFDFQKIGMISDVDAFRLDKQYLNVDGTYLRHKHNFPVVGNMHIGEDGKSYIITSNGFLTFSCDDAMSTDYGCETSSVEEEGSKK
jgi:hypothetical protein